MALVNRPHFTLHVRLTRDCNAHCSYCSSAGAQNGRMQPDVFAKALDWVAHAVFPRLGVGKRHHLTVEYLGGEVLLVPHAELVANVEHARATLSRCVAHVRDGAQSNLIGSPQRVKDLADLFDGRLGTSWDRRSGQRHIHGNAELYDAILQRSLRTLEADNGLKPGRVFVVDRFTAPFVAQEVRQAALEGYDLVLRPVFQGGSAVDKADLDTLEGAFLEGYNAWVESGRSVSVEPFTSLHGRQEEAAANTISVGSRGCPFQSDCAFRSLSIDPDGELYICQEMADSQHYSLGNAIRQEFDDTTWKRLAQRRAHLDESCKRCPWVDSCGGGCMNEAIARFGDPFAKTELCQVWTGLFRAIDANIAQRQPSMRHG